MTHDYDRLVSIPFFNPFFSGLIDTKKIWDTRYVALAIVAIPPKKRTMFRLGAWTDPSMGTPQIFTKIRMPFGK